MRDLEKVLTKKKSLGSFDLNFKVDSQLYFPIQSKR